MSLEKMKSKIVSTIREEFLKHHVRIDDENIRSSETKDVLSIWIEQKDGLNTSRDKFIVNKGDLLDGVNYSLAIDYRIGKWINYYECEFSKIRTRAPILMADDNVGDCFLVAEALKANLVENPFVAVSDGEELLNYLFRRGKFASPGLAPCFILLDLNMPRIDGREVLQVLKTDNSFRKIPVVVFSSSKAEQDILKAYDYGGNSFITKPSTFERLLEIVKILQVYWLDVIELPFG